MNVVREIRVKAAMTQDELATRSGVAQPNIAAYESGKRRPSATMLERLRRSATALPHDIVQARRGDLLRLAERHGMLDLRLFGSTARGVDASGSDVDLLVRVPPRTGLMAVSAFALDAERLLGLPVDVVTEGGLRVDHPIRRRAVPL